MGSPALEIDIPAEATSQRDRTQGWTALAGCAGLFAWFGLGAAWAAQGSDARDLMNGGKRQPIRTVEIGKHRVLRVNERPFFPIMSWAQATRRFQKLRGLGFNTFCGSGKSAREALEKARAAGGYAIVHATHFDPQLKGHPALLAYALRDEPDMGIQKGKPRVAADTVVKWYADAKRNDPTRPVFLNFTAGFMTYGNGVVSSATSSYYDSAAKGADILCFDIYPIYQRNRDDRLIWVADGVTQLRAHAGATRPVWAWIETSKGSKWITYTRQKDVTPEIVRSEVWMAVIRGATGIGYFTHAWRPRFKEFAPTPAVQQELKRINEQLTRLAPVILSGPARRRAAITIARGLHAEIMVREREGSVYLFANNLDMVDKGRRDDASPAEYRGGKARIAVGGLPAGAEIEVLGEGRTLTAEAGAFHDNFSPLAVHIYRIKNPP